MIGAHLVLAVLLINTCNGKTLKTVHLLYRHGARSPVWFYPNDKYQEKDWPDGSGRLTQKGMNMEYTLGKFLKQRYMTNTRFLNESYLHKQVYIRSSDVERCLQSAESQLAGLYPPKGYQVWNKNIPWQPIPVHTVPQKDDVLLIPNRVYCPRLQQKWKEYLKKPDVKIKLKENKALLRKLSNYSGMEVTIFNLGHIADPTVAELTEEFPIPDWLKKLWPETENFYNWLFNYRFTGDDEMGRLLGGTFLGKINNNMKKFSTKKSEDLFKMNIFSGHDTSLLSLSAALDVSIDIPVFSACIMIELYESENGYFVEMFYRNSLTNEVQRLKLKKCQYSCPLDEFVKLTKPRTTEDRSKICGLKGDLLTTYNLEILVASLSGVSLILLILLLYFIIKQSYSNKYKKIMI